MVKTMKLAIASILGVAMLAAAPIQAFAQDGGKGDITLDMEQADVHEALRALFKSTNLSYSIDPQVQGLVTLSLHNVPFQTALENVLKQVKATYRIEAGVYMILLREDPVVPKEDLPTLPDKPNHVRRHVHPNHADPMLIATLIGSKDGNSSFSLAPELSTVLNTPRGGGFGNSGFGNSQNGNNSGFGNNNGFGNGQSGFGGPGRGGPGSGNNRGSGPGFGG